MIDVTCNAGWIDFELDGRPYVPVHINGMGPFRLLFDTGCIGCRITIEAADRLGLRASVQDDLAVLRDFRIGRAAWRDFKVGVYDETPSFELLGRRFDGFLGNGFIWYARDAYGLVVDYVRRRLRFVAASDLHERDNPIQVSLENYYTVVPARIGGKGPYRFLLDTGAGRCVVSKSLAAGLGLSLGKAVTARGGAHDLEGHRSVVRSLTVGDVTVKEMGVDVLDCGEASALIEAEVDGYLGTNFLQHCVIGFDYRKPSLSVSEGL